VFLSHSSRDKSIVDGVFNELHKAGIRAWYDRYEIDPGDSITDKINEGLASSQIGLLFFSKNFIDSKSGWPTKEANYFFQKL
ncbi:toll/interleukin-1 receptor domain-containing protein, partial [Bacteroides thetaiotaomicron]|uniref:toll/interleukin-1 receptor domain-containing protein n=3 Tax=cellular organisms TaxID=131567 RepID=UPI001929893C